MEGREQESFLAISMLIDPVVKVVVLISATDCMLPRNYIILDSPCIITFVTPTNSGRGGILTAVAAKLMPGY